MPDSFELQRFVDAQDGGRTYDRAINELRAGSKRSHWMWFVFPQIAGLGHSSMARRYAISSLAEAQAYLEHPVLGARLRQSADILLQLGSSDAVAIFGPIDGQKLRSSMTLFARADPTEMVFQGVLDRFFAGQPDPETDRRV